jgi:hypothetical protein
MFCWSGDEQDAADRLAAFGVGVRRGGVGQRVGPVDDHAQGAARHVGQQRRDALVRAAACCPPLSAEPLS